MSVRVTAADIALHLGLAKSTVTHVLSGRAEQLRISAATQARVHEVVREMGYRPNASARAVGSGRFGCAALIQPLNRIYLPTGLLLGIAAELQQNDMSLMVSETQGNDADFLPKVVREVVADGLLINRLTAIEPRLLETLHALDTPAIWINNKQPVDAAYPDDLRAARWVTQHLTGWGHKRIAYIESALSEGTEIHYSSCERRQGFEAVMRESGLEPQFFYLPPTPGTLDEIRADTRLAALLEFLSSDDRPTAFVTYGGDVVLPFLQAAAQLGLRIPRDLSLATFEDAPNTQIGRAVTSICSNIGVVGQQAVRLLLRKIENPLLAVPATAVQPWFFEGDTTGAPP